MGLLDNNSYWNNKGARTDFVMSNADNRQNVEETLEVLVSYRNFKPDVLSQINEEIEQAITKAQGGPMPLGRL